jgi:hypothetical protein
MLGIRTKRQARHCAGVTNRAQRRLYCDFHEAFSSHILECIAGGCPLHVDPASYFFNTVSSASAIAMSSPSNEQSAQYTAARAHATMAYSFFLRYTFSRIALDVSETEATSCFDATHVAATRDCRRELPLSFLTKSFALSHDAAAFGDISETDMQFLDKYSPALHCPVCHVFIARADGRVQPK